MPGLAKEYVVPGWRVGWVTIHDAPIRTQGHLEIQLNINDQVLTSLQGYHDTNGMHGAPSPHNNADVMQTVMGRCYSKDVDKARGKDSVDECKRVLSEVSTDANRNKMQGEGGVGENLIPDNKGEEIFELHNLSNDEQNISSQSKRETNSTMTSIKSPNRCERALVIKQNTSLFG